MKYHKSHLIKIHKILALFLSFIIISILSSCQVDKIPRHSNEFYVSDFAGALSQATKENIVYYGEQIYEGTKNIETIGGLQIVFATFLLTDGQSSAEYDLTEIYRKWKIGKNDMGILTVLFLEETNDYDFILKEVEVEVGYRMEQYLTAGEMGRLLDLTLNNNEYYYDYDLACAHLLFEYLVLATNKVYPDHYVGFTYDLEEYISERENFSWHSSYGTDSMNYFYYIFSPYSSLAEKLLAILGLIIFALFGFSGLFLKRTRGAGGSSGGMRVFRKR